MKRLIFVVTLVTALGCKEKSKTGPLEKPGLEIVQNDKDHPGKKILETECYICHNPKASEESMIAPPMIAIKQHYIDTNTTKEEFTEALIQWIIDPETTSKMPDARKRFGVMPYIPYTDDVITQLADYLYDNEIEKPAWFDAHQTGLQEQQGQDLQQGMPMEDAKSGETQKSYAAIGMEYAMAAKAALGKNLIKAIQEKGSSGAVAFCNVSAIPLTDSISLMNNTIINRVSDKPRNQNNVANEEESGYITYFKKLTVAGKEPKPIIKTENGQVNFYYPISTNAMCLQCHGTPNEAVKPETLKVLKNLYPLDKALGYKENEVRGIWAINFDEKE